MQTHQTAADELLTPAEVAAILFVDPKTVTRWARAGKLDAIRTPGGHRRYLRSDVMAIMTGHHTSQRSEPATSPAESGSSTDGAPEGAEGTAPAASVSDAIAVALEAEAAEAAEAVVLSTAAALEAAKRAAEAATKARSARAFVTAEAARASAARAVQVPVQRAGNGQDPVSD